MPVTRNGLTKGLLSLAAVIGTAMPADAQEGYNPRIDPAEFSTDITLNPYLALPVGKKMVFEAETEDGRERVVVVVPGWTRTIMGVGTLVYWDRVYLDGELVEDTRDYLAQHENGDVWYFGEDVDNYEDGRLADHEGAWLSGVDGALPGIWLTANAGVSDEYRQEYDPGKAEDMARVVALDETVETPLGTFAGCQKTFEWSPLFAETANKYYCRDTGSVVLEVDLVGGGNAVETRTVIVSVGMGKPAPLPAAYADEGVEPGVAGLAGSDDNQGAEDDDDGRGDEAADVDDEDEAGDVDDHDDDGKDDDD